MRDPQMLTLHYAPDNASLVLRLALEEAGVPYETVLVDRATNAQRSPGYLALNATGLIPTLVTPDGPISETGACLLWLVDTYPEAGLGPAVGAPSRGAFLRSLFYLSNTVHADLIRVFYPDRVVPPEAVEQHQAIMADRLTGHLAILNHAAREAWDLFVPPSALALYLGPLLRWSALYPVRHSLRLNLSHYPTLLRLLHALERRPSVRAAVLAEGLGPAPFTAPRLPNPPEGSAT